MRRYLYIILLLLLASCNVHEWPEASDLVKCQLSIDFATNITEWEHTYDESQIVDNGNGNVYNNIAHSGQIRYIIRAYPKVEKMRSTQNYIKEFVFTRNITEGYDCDYIIELPSGEYNLLVWSDLVPYHNHTPYYNADDFAEIYLQGDYVGNTNHRDAFRGFTEVSLVAKIQDEAPEIYNVTMERPMAKYEFITNDVKEFITREASRLEALKGNENSEKSENGESGEKGEEDDENENEEDSSTRAIDIEDYKVVFYYIGFAHDTYSMYDDKPIDSTHGLKFETTLKSLDNGTASLGFDYSFVNGTQSTVAVQIGIYDNVGVQLSLTEVIKVPVKRNHHTILRGSFLMTKASGGVAIDPSFEGDYNLPI